MTTLADWLTIATRKLSDDSMFKVRVEIHDHYESALEAALKEGCSAETANLRALQALGDPTLANRQYREVLLTTREERMLRDAMRESSAVCSRPWLKWLMIALPVVATVAAFTLQLPFAAIATMSLFLAAPFLPIYTPQRSRIFRVLKWTIVPASIAYAFSPDVLKYSWLLCSCLWPFLWVEWNRASIRRKLPQASWPKPLYL